MISDFRYFHLYQASCMLFLYCFANESNGVQKIRRIESWIFGMQSILSFMLYPMVGIGLGDL